MMQVVAAVLVDHDLCVVVHVVVNVVNVGVVNVVVVYVGVVCVVVVNVDVVVGIFVDVVMNDELVGCGGLLCSLLACFELARNVSVIKIWFRCYVKLSSKIIFIFIFFINFFLSHYH